jgi:hypothetical protein
VKIDSNRKKETDGAGRARSEETARRSDRRRYAVLAAALGALLLTLLAAPFVSYLIDYRYTPERPLPPSREGLAALGRMALAVPGAYGRRLTGEPHIPAIHLEIRFRHMHRLIQKREEALAAGVLVSSDDDLVPAYLSTDEGRVRVRARLKGDLPDHLRGRRWSYRIEVRDGASVFGMRRFSIQSPYVRGFHREALFFDFLRDHGLLAPRHFFVDLTVNGERIGVMALEEHFSKELLEAQERREGVILKYDESELWQAVQRLGKLPFDYMNWRNTPVTAFQPRRVSESPQLAAQFDVAGGMLRAVMRDALAPSDLFDAALWGRYLAICELWSASHAMYFNNLRMYFNPLSQRLEPIAFDANRSKPVVRWPGWRCQGGAFAMVDDLLDDPRMREAFLVALAELAPQVASEAFEREMRAREAPLLDAVRVDFPWVRPLDFAAMRARAARLAGAGNGDMRELRFPRVEGAGKHPEDADYPAVVRAALVEREGDWLLELVNVLSRPVRVEQLRFVPQSLEESRPLASQLRRPLPIDLPATRWPRAPAIVSLPVPPGSAPEGGAWGIEGAARVGGDRLHAFAARRAPATRTRGLLPSVGWDEVLARHPFLERDPGRAGEDGDWLRARSGRHRVEGWLVLPEGAGLRLGPGTELRFAPGTALVASGPLEFDGTEAQPVVLAGREEGIERAGGWGGVAVLESDRPSRWVYVEVRDTTGVERGAWRLTGGVTFRRAEVELREVRMLHSRAEDALNLVRSRFALHGGRIEDAVSDALDADFCRGSIEGGVWSRVGGDGVDVSGSEVEVRGLRLASIGDKALSVGERSRLRAEAISVDGSGVGVASKDASVAHVAGSRLANIERVGLMAYVKKTEYGPAELRAEAVEIDAREQPALVQHGSRLEIDGVSQPAQSIDVDALYDGGSMQK